MSDVKVMEKIQKLLALAERAGTEEEAETAFEKARALMVQHAIEEADLKARGDGKAEKIVERFVVLKARDEIHQAKAILLNAIAKANRCTVLLYKGRDKISIIGYESDTVFVEMLWSSVLIQMTAAKSRALKDYKRDTPEYLQVSRYIFLNSFSLGYAGRIGQRLMERAATSDKTSGTDLVLRDRSKDVEDWVLENKRPKKSKAVSRSVSGAAQSAGFRAGGNADLSGGRNNVGTRAGGAIGR